MRRCTADVLPGRVDAMYELFVQARPSRGYSSERSPLDVVGRRCRRLRSEVGWRRPPAPPRRSRRCPARSGADRRSRGRRPEPSSTPRFPTQLPPSGPPLAAIEIFAAVRAVAALVDRGADHLMKSRRPGVEVVLALLDLNLRQDVAHHVREIGLGAGG